MARIFNIYFAYNNKQYNAVVSVKKTAFYTEYHLSNLEEDLLPFLPGTKILSTGSNHFVFQHANQDHDQPLMKEIIRAVSEHMHLARS